MWLGGLKQPSDPLGMCVYMYMYVCVCTYVCICVCACVFCVLQLYIVSLCIFHANDFNIHSTPLLISNMHCIC